MLYQIYKEGTNLVVRFRNSINSVESQLFYIIFTMKQQTLEHFAYFPNINILFITSGFLGGKIDFLGRTQK